MEKLEMEKTDTEREGEREEGGGEWGEWRLWG